MLLYHHHMARDASVHQIWGNVFIQSRDIDVFEIQHGGRRRLRLSCSVNLPRSAMRVSVS